MLAASGVHMIFKQAPGFLNCFCPGKSVCVCACCVYVCVCVCVSPPQAIKNQLCQMKPQQKIKQVLLLFSFFIWHLLSILLMGVALVTKRVMSYCQRRAQGNAVLTVHSTVKAV